MLKAYVSSVSVISDVCFKCFIWSCICCYDNIRMFQAYISNVSDVLGRMLQVF
jgi:hypothetical protein